MKRERERDKPGNSGEPRPADGAPLAGAAGTEGGHERTQEMQELFRELEVRRAKLESENEELRRKEVLLNEAQILSKAGGWHYDLETKTITWTDEIYRIYGVSHDYNPCDVERSIRFYAPQGRPRLKEAFERAVEFGECYDLELEFMSEDGTAKWVRTIGTPLVRDGRVVEVVGNLMDITSQKQSEERQELLVQVLSHLNDPEDIAGLSQRILLLLKTYTGVEAIGLRIREGEDFPYFESNGFPAQFIEKERYLCARDAKNAIIHDREGHPYLECMCGNVLCGRTDPALPFFTEGGSFWTNNTTELLATTTVEDRQTRTRHRCNGEGYESVALIPLRAGNSTVGLLQLNDRRPGQFTLDLIRFIEGIGASLGIAVSRKQMEEALRQSEQRFSAAFEYAAIGMALISLDGHWIKVNRTVSSILGYSDSELRTKTFQDITHPDDLATGLTKFHQLLAGEIQSFKMEKRYFHKSGSVISVLLSVSLLRDQQGRPLHLISQIEDITERKQAEADRLILSKLESTGILAGGIAHDFNNLLTTILLCVDLAKADLPPESEGAHCLGEALRAVSAARSLAQQLLAFAHGGATLRTLTPLPELIREHTDLALRGSSTGSAFAFPPDLWEAEVEAGQIGQVIRNIVLNAREAMQSGGTVSIQAENMTLGPGSAQGLPEGDYVRVSIADRGPGIAREVLPRIFDPYYSTKERGAQKGMGLGLTICHTVMKKHGGAISVESETGAGAIFHLFLPASRARSLKKETPGSLPPPGRKRILVMDDEEAVRRAIALMLRRMDYDVEMAADGQIAIELFGKARDRGCPFDAVLLDLTVRGGTGGKEAIGPLHKIDASVVAIVMSGYSEDPVVLEYERYGFRAALAKPFRVEQLREALALTLGAEASGETRT